MAKIKSFTSLEQAKELLNILPHQSADMSFNVEKGYEVILYPYMTSPWVGVPCWSLTALLGVLPYCPNLSKHTDGKWYITTYPNDIHTCLKAFDNPVDACVAMIIKLNELKML